jgi:2'-5' RNA ligase
MSGTLKKRLYMFAIMPPGELTKRLESERQYFAGKYQCSAALKPPVHITIYAPFRDTEDLPERLNGMHEWAAKLQPLKIELRNFAWFDNLRSPVLYVHVERSEKLADLHVAFLGRLKMIIPGVEVMRGYMPHITIGYRDIPAESLPQIREEYATRRFEGDFDLRSIFLWEHDSKKWNVVDEYLFSREA